MEHPKTFLLKKIIGYKENGLSTLGQLHAKHVSDLVVVMTEFAEETAIELIERLAKGESVKLSDGRVIRLEKISKKKRAVS